MPPKKLALSLDKLDALSKDIQVLELEQQAHGGKHLCDGPLEEADKKTFKWSPRYFVLTDSCLVSYPSSDTDSATPETTICIGKCKIQLVDSEEDLKSVVGDTIDCTGKKNCMLITTRPDKEQILLSAPDEAARQRWVNAIRIGRTVTHANMVKLAVENRVLADDLKSPPDKKSGLNSLAIFSNRDYIQKTPIAGGAEGWLRTAGFVTADVSPKMKRKLSLKGVKASMFASKGDLSELQKRYCILRDSHLLIYEAGDALVNPRGIMSLVQSKVEMLPDEDTEKNGFKFRCRAVGDSALYIDFTASSDRRRRKWAFALKIGAHVTFTDFKLLMSEHSRLAKLVEPEAEVKTVTDTTPDAPDEPPKVDNEPALAEAAEAAATTEVILDDDNEQGEVLDAGEVQAYDSQGNPILRAPDGKLVAATETGTAEVDTSAARYSMSGQELDAFNRPLPTGAKAMFTADNQPIGVGPDKKHYLSDGTEVAADAEHFDREGNKLDREVVQKAEIIADKVSFDLKVKAAMSRDDSDSAVDALGRTVRGETRSDGKLLNKEGKEIVPTSARRIKAGTGEVVDYKAQENDSSATATLGILVDEQADEGKRIGEVEINKRMTLRDIRNHITSNMDTNFIDFVFIADMTPLLKYEETSLLAMQCLPEITIRGKELKPIKAKVFSKKIAEMQKNQESKDAEKSEFEQMMAKVRNGQFLKPARNVLLD